MFTSVKDMLIDSEFNAFDTYLIEAVTSLKSVR